MYIHLLFLNLVVAYPFRKAIVFHGKLFLSSYNDLANKRDNYWPPRKSYYEEYIKHLNSKNVTLQNNAILQGQHYHHGKNDNDNENDDQDDIYILHIDNNETQIEDPNQRRKKQMVLLLQPFLNNTQDDDEKYSDNEEYSPLENLFGRNRNQNGRKQGKKSENFEVVFHSNFSFKDIGGYENIKSELNQCVDILMNYKKYAPYNVRVPKGIILEGPPGNGKTLLAKGFAGETKTAFIPVSGSQFQEKYVGVGPTRVRELFDLARKNIPCIIFIDEIDAIGRSRSTDSESSSSERDSTLNELLINLDGFKTTPGIFLMGATNRADLLDPALTRPGRIDKKIFIGPPDSTTREAILNIHLKGKPYDKSVVIKDLVDLTAGFSGAQIENLLNEAMLHALRYNRDLMEYRDLDIVINKIMAGWQPTEHQFTEDIIDRITIHEMGHAIVGILSKHHSKVSKVVINLSSPNSPGYTMFETSTSNIYKRESLFEHLMILLAGRISEEVFYDVSTTTGAINDFEEALKLAEKMIMYYGMGTNIIYPKTSEKYKQIMDDEVLNLINDAYCMSEFFVKQCKDLISECAVILKRDKILKTDALMAIIHDKYPHILDLKNDM